MLNFTPIEIDYAVPDVLKRKSWGLDMLVTDNWKSAKTRILFVIDHVPTEDLRKRQLLSGESGRLFYNILDRGFKLAQTWGSNISMNKVGIGFVSFGYFKTLDLDSSKMSVAEKASVKRLRKIIAKVKPTHVHYFGEVPAIAMGEIEYEQRGWVVKRKEVDSLDPLTVSFNISVTRQGFERDASDDDEDDDEGFGDSGDIFVEESNLLGHASENIARLLHGGYPYNLRDLKPEVKLVDTMEAFESLMDKLYQEKKVAVDTETANLSVLANSLLTIQFTLGSEPDVSYLLPMKHMSSPWNPNQLKSIYFTLREYFAQRHSHNKWNAPFLIFQNASFDIRIIKREFGIPVMYFRVWDVMLGEHGIDENLKALPAYSRLDAEKNERQKPWALDQILNRYENDWYAKSDFGKEDRVTIALVPLSEAVQLYCGMDTISIMHIYRMQQRRVEDMYGKAYLKRYRRYVLGVTSDTSHVMSAMMENGVLMDRAYVTKQYAIETSDIDKERMRLIEELNKMPSVQQANEILKKRQGVVHSLFAGTEFEEVNLFDITDRKHQHLLFFEVLELDAPDKTSSGEPSLNKAFRQHYGNPDDSGNRFVKEVELFSGIVESKKVGGYIKAFYVKLAQPDGMIDDRLRASYGMVMVVTGRSNSFGPSLQQTPMHGQYAKLIKRCFICNEGRVLIKMDYSAHEVGCWGIMSGDNNLANNLKAIYNMILDFRRAPTPEKKIKIKDADIHRLNYQGFTGTPLAKIDKPMRQKSKGITFGAMYGKSVRTMARDLNTALKEMEKIYDRFFGKFKKAKQFLNKCVSNARERFYVENPLGFRRHLFGYLSGNNGVAAAMDRRAMNSPIQGFASQLCYIAARLLQIQMDTLFHENGMYGKPTWNKEKGIIEVEQPPFNLNCMIHDSTETEVSYELAPLVLRAMEYCATERLVEYVEKMYEFQFNVRPQVDFDIGDSADSYSGWDYSKPSLQEAVKAAYKHQKGRGLKPNPKEVMKMVKPTPEVKAMMKQIPLKLRAYEDE